MNLSSQQSGNNSTNSEKEVTTNMRVKRSRNTDHQQLPGGVTDDELMNMDPSLMTERQQLAFLLRTTAPRKSSDSQSSESSEDELLTKKIKRIHRNDSSSSTSSSKSSPKSTKTTNNSNSTTTTKDKRVVVYKGRGRPPKNAIKLPHGKSLPVSASSSSNNSPRSVSTPVSHSNQNPKKLLKVKAPTSSNSSSSTSSPTYHLKHATESPSSASDASNVEIFQGSPLSSKTQGDFWSLNCALCCTHAQSGCFPSDVLFLCTSCDQKYPTQRALGKV